jgi:hypothetical protein
MLLKTGRQCRSSCVRWEEAEVVLYYNVNSQEIPLSAIDTNPYPDFGDFKLGTFSVDYIFQSFLFSIWAEKQTGTFYAYVQYFFEDTVIQQMSTRKLVFFCTQNMISQLLIIFAEVRILLPHPYSICTVRSVFLLPCTISPYLC